MKIPPPRVGPPLVEGTEYDINYIRLATWNHTMDEVDGFCGPSRVGHKCVSWFILCGESGFHRKS